MIILQKCSWPPVPSLSRDWWWSIHLIFSFNHTIFCYLKAHLMPIERKIKNEKDPSEMHLTSYSKHWIGPQGINSILAPSNDIGFLLCKANSMQIWYLLIILATEQMISTEKSLKMQLTSCSSFDDVKKFFKFPYAFHLWSHAFCSIIMNKKRKWGKWIEWNG